MTVTDKWAKKHDEKQEHEHYKWKSVWRKVNNIITYPKLTVCTNGQNFNPAIHVTSPLSRIRCQAATGPDPCSIAEAMKTIHTTMGEPKAWEEDIEEVGGSECEWNGVWMTTVE